MLRADPDCNPLGNQCVAGLESMAITLRLEDAARPLEPFRVEVEIDAANAREIESVKVRFSMVGMNMGINQFQLDRGADGSWQGLAILPVCSTGRVDWLADVEAQHGREAYTAEFFVTVVP